MGEWATLGISFVSLGVSIAAFVCGYRYNNKVMKATLLLDFSKRYQDIMMAMPKDEVEREKYVLLYFDLCSEEFRLWSRGGIVDDNTWDLWRDGMRLMMRNNAQYRNLWLAKRGEYDSEGGTFQTFFDGVTGVE